VSSSSSTSACVITPWQDKQNGTATDHYVAKRISSAQYTAFGNKYGYINKFDLYKLTDGNWVEADGLPSCGQENSSSSNSSIVSGFGGLWSKSYYGTSYQYLFENGKGSMPGKNYPFTYTVNGNQITISGFTGVTMKNGTYTFAINGTAMAWSGVASYSFAGTNGTISSASSVVSSSSSSIVSSSSVPVSSSSVSTSWATSSSASSSHSGGDYTMNCTTGGSGTYTYKSCVPQNVGRPIPLVVSIHGCGQSGDGYENSTGWTELAKKMGFAVLYPKKGNGGSCWANKFASGDYNSEVNTIIGYINQVKSSANIDNSKVYVAGLSAGAGIANCLLELKSDVFAGGAPMSGPNCQSGTVKANKKVIIWHTQNDSFSGDLPGVFNSYVSVNGGNASSLAVGKLKASAKSHDYKNYNNLVAFVQINGMTHGTAVDPGTGVDQGGSTVSFATDWDLHSSYYSAVFWGLNQ
jgi:poly(hydroxyalkanoate) depolymerase family esterase